MTRREWVDIETHSDLEFSVGDEVYHEDLLLGWIDEIKKPWFGKPEVIMILASYEAKKFIWEEKGIGEGSIIQIIPTRWARIKSWFRSLSRKVKI